MVSTMPVCVGSLAIRAIPIVESALDALERMRKIDPERYAETFASGAICSTFGLADLRDTCLSIANNREPSVEGGFSLVDFWISRNMMLEDLEKYVGSHPDTVRVGLGTLLNRKLNDILELIESYAEFDEHSGPSGVRMWLCGLRGDPNPQA